MSTLLLSFLLLLFFVYVRASEHRRADWLTVVEVCEALLEVASDCALVSHGGHVLDAVFFGKLVKDLTLVVATVI